MFRNDVVRRLEFVQRIGETLSLLFLQGYIVKAQQVKDCSPSLLYHASSFPQRYHPIDLWWNENVCAHG